MITTLVTIGNSRGIRIPKPLIEQSGIVNRVKLHVKKGEIRIVAAPAVTQETSFMSEKSLATDWNRPEEDEAWEHIQ